MASMHDPARRRRTTRSGRERGCWAYIPADVLRDVGIDPDGPAPYFRTWAGPKRKNPTVLVVLYQEA